MLPPDRKAACARSIAMAVSAGRVGAQFREVRHKAKVPAPRAGSCERQGMIVGCKTT